jgi:myosin heavy subunit
MTTGLEVKYRSNSNKADINADIRKIISQNDKQNETHGGMSIVYIFGLEQTKEDYVKEFKKKTIELTELTRIEDLLDKMTDPALANVGKHFFIVKNKQDIKYEQVKLDSNYSAKQDCYQLLLDDLKVCYEKHIHEAKKNNEKSQSDTFLSVMVPLIKYMYGEDKCDRAENEIIELLHNYRKFLQQFDCFEKFVESKQSNTIMQQIKTNWDHQVHKDQAEAKSLSEKKQELKSIINAIRTKTEEIKVKLPEDFPEADGLTNDNDVTTIESTIRLFINTLPKTDAHNKTLPKTDALNYRKSLSEVWEKAIDNTKTIESQQKQLKDQSKKQLKDQSQIDQQVKAAADKAAPPRPKAAAANKTVAAASSGYPAEAKAAAIKAQAAEAKPETAKAETKPKLSKSQKKAKAKEAAEKEEAEKEEADQAQAAKAKAAKEERAKKQKICAAEAKEINRFTQLLEGPATKDFSKAMNKDMKIIQRAEQQIIPLELQTKAQEIRNILISGEPTAEQEAIETINKIDSHKNLKSILTANFESGRTLLHEAFSKDYDQFVSTCFDKLENDLYAIQLMSSGPKTCFHEAAISNSSKVTTFIFKKYYEYKPRQLYAFGNMYSLITQPAEDNQRTAWDYAVINNSEKFIRAICESVTDTERNYIFSGFAGDRGSFINYVNENRDTTLQETDVLWVLLVNLGLHKAQQLLDPLLFGTPKNIVYSKALLAIFKRNAEALHEYLKTKRVANKVPDLIRF